MKVSDCSTSQHDGIYNERGTEMILSKHITTITIAFLLVSFIICGLLVYAANNMKSSDEITVEVVEVICLTTNDPLTATVQ